MKKAEQGTQAIRTGGRSVPLLSGSLFLVGECANRCAAELRAAQEYAGRQAAYEIQRQTIGSKS